MSEAVKYLSEKRYNEMKRTVITDAIELVLNTIANQTSLSEKDKTFTTKKLTNTIELIYNKLSELNNDQFPLDIINSLKPHITSQLSNTFCYKPPIKNDNTRNITDLIPVIFSPNIQSAIEIPQKEIRKDIKLPKLPEYYRFFAFALPINDEEYIITYAEENKSFQ